jgi:hypothetical protein
MEKLSHNLGEKGRFSLFLLPSFSFSENDFASGHILPLDFQVLKRCQFTTAALHPVRTKLA